MRVEERIQAFVSKNRRIVYAAPFILLALYCAPVVSVSIFSVAFASALWESRSVRKEYELQRHAAQLVGVGVRGRVVAPETKRAAHAGGVIH